MTTTFAYKSSPLTEFKVTETDNKGNVKAMNVDGVNVQPTQRFWTSLCSANSTLGLSTKLFKLFNHAEVFERLTQKSGRTNVNYTLATGDKGTKLLAAIKPTKPVAKYDDVMGMLNKYNGQDIKYEDNKGSNTGIVQSWHTPPRMEAFKVAGDVFMPKYIMETPIDGFGKPLIYLSMIRQVCTNGAIAYAKAFRSELSIGRGANDNVMHSLERALDSYSNEEGYMALKARLESATKSWASISEVNNVFKNLSKMNSYYVKKDTVSAEIERRGTYTGEMPIMGGDGAATADMLNGIGFKIQKAFSSMTGDLCHIYGLAHLDALTRKKMASLPTRASVYDVINFCTEVATHYSDANGARKMQAIVGGMLGGSEYDLENSMDEMPDFADWQIANGNETKDLTESRQELLN